MVKSRILFDLDGTLIDSAPAILHSLEAVFAAAQRKPIRPLTVDLIGPPIEKIVQGLLTTQDAYRADAFIEAFKQRYDNLDLHLTYVYEGVPTMLQSLTEAGYESPRGDSVARFRVKTLKLVFIRPMRQIGF